MDGGETDSSKTGTDIFSHVEIEGKKVGEEKDGVERRNIWKKDTVNSHSEEFESETEWKDYFSDNGQCMDSLPDTQSVENKKRQ